MRELAMEVEVEEEVEDCCCKDGGLDVGVEEGLWRWAEELGSANEVSSFVELGLKMPSVESVAPFLWFGVVSLWASKTSC